jgi:hypothetical protein
MEKSKANWILRKGSKRRTKKARRRRVLGFYALVLISLLTTLGADHNSFRGLEFAIAPVVIAMGVAVSRGLRSDGHVLVRSLDDRARVEYGVNFDQLRDAEQKGLLGRYRMFAVPLDRNPDERHRMSRLQADGAASRFLTAALPWFVAVYWMMYLWIPPGGWRERIMDSPVLISWLAVFVVSLPRVIEMWTEPEEVPDPTPVASAVQI